MKIQIITYSRTKNYGGILQAYGLFKYLSDSKYDVEFIDYLPPRCNVENKEIFTENTVWMSKIWGRNAFSKKIWKIVMYPKVKKNFAPFRSFLDSRAKFTDRYESIDELIHKTPEADIYITGSDQVWNSQLGKSKSLDDSFFLSFVKGVKKISYAPSFGGSTLSEREAVEIKELLSDYSHISVRESGGQKLLSDIGIKSEIVVDPTILCNPTVWHRLVEKKSTCDSIFLYLINFDSRIYQLARKTALVLDKKLKIIVLNQSEKYKYIKNWKDVLICPSVENWLSSICNADFVITNSFHACVFSIVFHTKFIVNTSSRKNMSDRIVDLLGKTGFENKILDDFDYSKCVKLYESEYDFVISDKSLEMYRHESAQWIENAINN